jgi:plastocyanin
VQSEFVRVVSILLVALVALALAGPAGAATKTVTIRGSGFSPSTVTITAGDTVKWVNRDNDRHQVLADNGQFVSPILQPGQTFAFTFKGSGTYGYKDELNMKHAATVVVRSLPPSVTLASSLPIADFGTKVTLSGVVSSHASGQEVGIFSQPYGQPSPIELARVLTTTGGTFSLVVAPRILTAYQASWSGAFASPVTVQVRPHLTLGYSGAWLVHAWGGRSFAGRTVLFQRLNALTGQWVTLRRVPLNAQSAARVTVTLPKGVSLLRLTMSVNQAGAGYLGVIGDPITWRRR